MSPFQHRGPYDVRRLGDHRVELSVPIPKDADGMTGRECPEESCTPRYFKIRSGTGAQDGPSRFFCPYCRRAGESGEFHTEAQREFARQHVRNYALELAHDMLSQSLRLGPTGRRTLVDGCVKITAKIEPLRPCRVPNPREEDLRRDVICPNCGLEHAVFGIARWCPDCGADIFPAHVEAEFETLRCVLRSVPQRQESLGAAVAGRDVENALEDTVSIFEAVLKVLARWALEAAGRSAAEASKVVDAFGNALQNVERGRELYRQHFGFDFCDGLEADTVQRAERIFAKRHVITHNLGMIDRRYLGRVGSGEIEGREIRVGVEEVEEAIDFARFVIGAVHQRLAPQPLEPTGE